MATCSTVARRLDNNYGNSGKKRLVTQIAAIHSQEMEKKSFKKYMLCKNQKLFSKIPAQTTDRERGSFTKLK
jgi:hypothetical protein